jgi:hypothetical protein
LLQRRGNSGAICLAGPATEVFYVIFCHVVSLTLSATVMPSPPKSRQRISTLTRELLNSVKSGTVFRPVWE